MYFLSLHYSSSVNYKQRGLRCPNTPYAVVLVRLLLPGLFLDKHTVFCGVQDVSKINQGARFANYKLRLFPAMLPLNSR